MRQLLSQLNIGAASNDLRSLKAYLDSDACTIRDNAMVEYTYTPDPLIYRQNPDGTVQKLNPDTTFSDIASENTSVTSLMTSMASPYVFCEMAETPALYEDQYDVKAGRWPEKYNELVLTLNADGSVSDYALYAMGLRDQAELDKIYSTGRGSVTVRSEDRMLVYTAEHVRELEPAYAVTIHKSQGSEFPAVIIPVMDVPPKLCYRNLLYTGVTRAKTLCILAGHSAEVAQMVRSVRRNKRFSCLADLIRDETL